MRKQLEECDRMRHIAIFFLLLIPCVVATAADPCEQRLATAVEALARVHIITAVLQADHSALARVEAQLDATRHQLAELSSVRTSETDLARLETEQPELAAQQRAVMVRRDAAAADAKAKVLAFEREVTTLQLRIAQNIEKLKVIANALDESQAK